MDLQQARFLAFLAGLVTFLSWETVAPHHAPTVSRLRRWSTNLALALVNGAVVTALCATCFAVAARRLSPWRFGPLEMGALPFWPRVALEIVLLDLVTYLLHRTYHRVPILWLFHQVHHTDLDLDVSSASRFHLGEVLVSALGKLCTVVLLGISYQGLIAFEILLLAAAQFQHSNIRLQGSVERALWWLFVPPAMHRVHHTPLQVETDSNYGTLFVAWDLLFGTLRRPTIDTPPFGLDEERDLEHLGLWRLLRLPFRRRRVVEPETDRRPSSSSPAP